MISPEGFLEEIVKAIGQNGNLRRYLIEVELCNEILYTRGKVNLYYHKQLITSTVMNVMQMFGKSTMRFVNEVEVT